jgi:hypothetical protein
MPIDAELIRTTAVYETHKNKTSAQNKSQNHTIASIEDDNENTQGSA